MANITLIISLVVFGIIFTVLLCIAAWVFDVVPLRSKDYLKNLIGHTLSLPPDSLQLCRCPRSYQPPIPEPDSQQAVQSPHSSRVSRSLQMSIPAATIVYPPKSHQSSAKSCRLSTASFDSTGSNHKYTYNTWGIQGCGTTTDADEYIKSTTPDTPTLDPS